MDKSRFIEIAPIYYALAVISFVRRTSQQAFIDTALYRDYGEDNEYDYLAYSYILDRAIEWLEERDMVTLERDDFGPSIISPSPDFKKIFEDLRANPAHPFRRYTSTTDSESWLRESLKNLNREHSTLDIKESDFDSPNLEWEPIPLDRTHSKLQEAISN